MVVGVVAGSLVIGVFVVGVDWVVVFVVGVD